MIENEINLEELEKLKDENIELDWNQPKIKEEPTKKNEASLKDFEEMKNDINEKKETQQKNEIIQKIEKDEDNSSAEKYIDIVPDSITIIAP
ncbi:MAG: hypothetical protein PHS42_08390 [Sulfurimonas sp.]|nr:hypothetical protein [Sulfurimonas sp.]MDD3835479.1 hypothetical protein [Sulfurimonas sp.]